jgi:enamine deaminase RidA (YjgF/YER057c/UK114 family)
MTKEIMTVHKALAELKVLDNRIEKTIRGAIFCAAAKQSMKKINGVPIEQFTLDSRSAYDSICDLISRRDAIKKAVSKSNAETHLTIVGVDYTVAEAISMNQHGIELKRRLLNELEKQYSDAVENIEATNAELSEKADSYVSHAVSLSDKNNMDAATLKDLRQDYIDRETMILIDGIDIKKVKDELASYIDAFEAEVDAALSTSNAMTEITIEY